MADPDDDPAGFCDPFSKIYVLKRFTMEKLTLWPEGESVLLNPPSTYGLWPWPLTAHQPDGRFVPLMSPVIEYFVPTSGKITYRNHPHSYSNLAQVLLLGYQQQSYNSQKDWSCPR